GNCTRSSENKRPVLLNPGGRRITLNDKLRAEGRHNVAQVDMPPVGTQGQAFDPLGTVNNSVRPFVGNFRVKKGISNSAFLNLRLRLLRKWVDYHWENLR